MDDYDRPFSGLLEIKQKLNERRQHVGVHLKANPDLLLNYIVGVVLVSDGACTSEKHLEWNVRYQLAQIFQTFPRTFVQETH